MPTFVDFAGMNTLVSSSIDGNTLSSGKNTEIADIQDDELVGINIHRNGPYGYSTWTQLRVSENPITRHHKANNTMTFVVQPGPIRNVLSTGELRVRDRYSALYTFTEPVLTKKSYPLVWNVGRHTKNPRGKINMSKPQRFSIISSFGNQKIGFANEEVDKQLKVNYEDSETEYDEIYDLYADGAINGEDSPLTYWEFLQYRETVFPHMKNQFQKENLTRENFKSFFRHKRADRAELFLTNSFGFVAYGGHSSFPPTYLTHSSWPLDPSDDFLTRDLDSETAESLISGNPDTSENASNIIVDVSDGGAGILQQNYSSFLSRNGNVQPNVSVLDALTMTVSPQRWLSPLPVYARRVTLSHTQSVSNPSGMEIPETGSANYGSTHPAYCYTRCVSGSEDLETVACVKSTWHNKNSKIVVEEADGTKDELLINWRLSQSSNNVTRIGAKSYRVQTKGKKMTDFVTQLTNAIEDSIAQDNFGGSISNSLVVVGPFGGTADRVFSLHTLTASAGQTIKFFPDVDADATATNVSNLTNVFFF